MIRPKNDMNTLTKNVWQWFDDKGLFNPVMQMLKVQEELGELASEIVRNRLDSPELQDALGDVLVTVIGMCHHLGYKPEDVLKIAYDEIKDRTGKTINDSFIKDKDLK